jgi:indole-3-glycerol phosphate synthase
MSDYLDILAKDAMETIEKSYYESLPEVESLNLSLKKAILMCESNPVITEIKYASPTFDSLKTGLEPLDIAKAMESGGATGISVLTEPKHFGGDIKTIQRIRPKVKLPILMKDIIIDSKQISAAKQTGADAILLILALFDEKYCKTNLDSMINEAQRSGLEVLLETHNQTEFENALESRADLIGINNRNLKTLKVDLDVTKKLLEEIDYGDRIIVSMSGIKTPSDIRFLRDCGARAFLIGSAIMLSNDITGIVGELVLA